MIGYLGSQPVRDDRHPGRARQWCAKRGFARRRPHRRDDYDKPANVRRRRRADR
jgi:hypothetical protein